MTLSGAVFPEAPDRAFLTLAATWTSDQADLLLGFVWTAYDRMRAGMPVDRIFRDL